MVVLKSVEYGKCFFVCALCACVRVLRKNMNAYTEKWSEMYLTFFGAYRDIIIALTNLKWTHT